YSRRATDKRPDTVGHSISTRREYGYHFGFSRCLSLQRRHMQDTIFGTLRLNNSIRPITGHGRRCTEIIHRGVHNPVPDTAHDNPLATPTTPSRELGHSSAAASPSSHSSVSDGRYSTTLFIMGSVARAARISSEDTPKCARHPARSPVLPVPVATSAASPFSAM